MPNILIQATDTLFFRDGRPFSMGDDSFAQGIFPPPPSVVYGALRSAYISKGIEDGLSQQALIAESEKLQLNFIAFQVGSSQYFPMPLDLIVLKEELKKRLKTAMPLELGASPQYSNAQTPQILESRTKEKTADEPFLIDGIGLKDYLSGNVNKLNVRPRTDFLTNEPKIGIGRDKNSNTAADGKLFRVQTVRPKTEFGQSLQFFLDFDGLGLPENGWLTLGGERRVAFFEQNKDAFELPKQDLNSEFFKIYMATPGVFKAGWQPKHIFDEYGLKLLAAALDRPLSVGGWDLENQRPKPMVQCVPAGSVYYVKANSKAAAIEAANAIDGKCISENLNTTNYSKQGFGLAYVGKIP